MPSHSVKRQNRLRREYLHKKSLLSKEDLVQQSKEVVRKALENGKKIPDHLAHAAGKLTHLLEYDDMGPSLAAELGGEASNIDDEYRWAGVEDPRIVITTSRDPSSVLRQFAKELRIMFPNAQRVNRGTSEINTLVEACTAQNFTDLIMLHETRGRPDNLVVSHLPNGPTAYFTLSDVVMRSDIPDIGKMSEQSPHLNFVNLKSKLGERVTSILKYLFPVPKEDSKRILSFINCNDYIFFRQHVTKKEEKKDVISEIGPRFCMLLYKIILGNISEEKAADTDYVLRPYTNTARKKLVLSNEEQL